MEVWPWPHGQRVARAECRRKKNINISETGVTRTAVAPGKSGGRVPKRFIFMKRPIPVKIPRYLGSVARLTFHLNIIAQFNAV